MLARRIQRREGLDDAALGDGAVAALADDAVELAAQRRKVGDLALHLDQVRPGDRVGRLAGTVRLIGKAE